MNTTAPQPTTPADGFYIYPARLSGAECVAIFAAGTLSAFIYAGEAQPVTALTAAHVAHDLACLNGEGVIFTPPAPTIGKREACELHKLMARAGVLSREHYAFAAAVVGASVSSLADLCPVEARAVRLALGDLPHASTFAA